MAGQEAERAHQPDMIPLQTEGVQFPDATSGAAPASTPLKEAQPAAPAAAPPPPNGGFKAWVQVLGAHFLFFNSW
jgi:hypothetical protein